MANPRLNPAEIENANALLATIRKRLTKLAGDDKKLLFAYRRRLIVKLTHDERGTPAQRNALKRQKHREQRGECALCKGAKGPLPLKYAELDRHEASAGYTAANTRLVHHECHVDDQHKKGYV